ncbi:tyrosine recombinase XerC [Kitasatospora sp. NPDC004615]|uniref:site-specific integrase n=1 Tax=unclassified Kitasatospora TaxID=2633591 RepID=UPI0036791652
MAAVLDGELRGVYENRRTTVASFLREWLTLQKARLAPKTYAGYAACVERGLIPAFGRHRLLDLRPQHIDDWITAQLNAGRGKVTVYRAASALRNALNTAVRCWRLRYNPAKHSVPPEPRDAERTWWTPDETAAFLRHGSEQGVPPVVTARLAASRTPARPTRNSAMSVSITPRSCPPPAPGRHRPLKQAITITLDPASPRSPNGKVGRPVGVLTARTTALGTTRRIISGGCGLPRYGWRRGRVLPVRDGRRAPRCQGASGSRAIRPCRRGGSASSMRVPSSTSSGS